MKCKDCLDKLEGYVDRELTGSEEAEVRAHLLSCNECEGGYRFNSQLKRLVKDCCCESAPEDLRTKLTRMLD